MQGVYHKEALGIIEVAYLHEGMVLWRARLLRALWKEIPEFNSDTNKY